MTSAIHQVYRREETRAQSLYSIEQNTVLEAFTHTKWVECITRTIHGAGNWDAVLHMEMRDKQRTLFLQESP